MTQKYATNRINEIQKHNNRVRSIREDRLPLRQIEAIDRMLFEGDNLWNDIMESLYHGMQPNFTTDQLSDFRQALEAFRQAFTEQEIHQYLVEQARKEANEK